ncbi:hypothetical protein Sjap_023395 [Stephania japonica]|uniref:DELLA protein n=1 Tax=Stephania japonica TaxID=461633 RepID=A0AAP0EIS6_9MAGN
MAPALFMPNECHSDGSDEVKGLDLTLSAMACYQLFPSLPTLDNNGSTWFFPSSDDPRSRKRLRHSLTCNGLIEGDGSLYSAEGSNGSYCSPYGSSGSNCGNISPYCGGGGGGSGSGNTSNISRNNSIGALNSLPKLQFRDHILTYTQRFQAAEAVEEAVAAMIGIDGDKAEEGNGDGMRLVQLLIACAEAVACRDRSHASALISELRGNALVFGTSFQRVASCFVQGLADRLALVQPLGAVGVVAPTMNFMAINSEKKEEASRLVYEVFPHIQFGHFVANTLIMEAFEGESLVHVIDLGMSLGLLHGHQWRKLIYSLANRSGQRPHRLRITGVGHRSASIEAIGEELELYAESLGINFQFSLVESNLENLRPEDFECLEGEVLVVNSILQLHCVVKESRGALNSVLQIIHELSPKVLVLVEQDSSHNGPFFLGRFMEALHYYSAIFDSLDAMLPKYDTRRAKMNNSTLQRKLRT